jgi:hypothetical protein
MRNCLLLIILLAAFNTSSGQSRFVQIIHNSPDTALIELDVYINDLLIADNLQFRSATAFLQIPDTANNTSTRIYISPENSTDTTNFYYQTIIPPTSGNYLAVIAGTFFQAPYTPIQPINIHFMADARITGSTPDNADVVFYHGSNDSPAIDIGEVGLNFPDIWINNISFGQFSNYRTMGDDNYKIGLYDEESVILAISYAGYFKGPEHDGKAYSLIASGFQIPEFNAFGPLFSMFIVGQDGGPFQEMLPAFVLDSASIQLIHGIQDPSASLIDIYLDNELWQDNMPFHSATPFLNIPANRDIRLTVCPSTSSDTTGSFFDELISPTVLNYTMVLAGMSNPTGFNPPEPIRLSIRENGRKTAIDSDEIDLLFYHAIPDGGTMDFRSMMPIVTTLANNLNFGSFNPSGYLEITPYDFSLNLTDESGNTIHNSFLFNALSENLAGEAIVMLASGFLNTENNPQGIPAGFWYTTAAGGMLIECPKVTGFEQVEQTIPVAVYPNPASNWLNILFEEVPSTSTKVRIFDVNGKLQNESGLSVGELQTILPISNLSNGLYLVEISNSDHVIRKKIHVIR